MDGREIQLRDAEGLEAAIAEMADSLAARSAESAPLRLVGVRTRGVPIALRLAVHLSRLLGRSVPVGALDITLYRDDLGDGRRWPVLRGTEIAFPVDGAEIVLVDDVLFTGRTVRAALNAVCDLGRPARIRLAVLVDRGHRELPIEPDVVGVVAEAGPGQRIVVRIRPTDVVEEIVRIDQPGHGSL